MLQFPTVKRYDFKIGTGVKFEDIPIRHSDHKPPAFYCSVPLFKYDPLLVLPLLCGVKKKRPEKREAKIRTG